ncbi:MAG: damage-inducible protein DinB, partial [Hyphomicrobium denitrificans]|nr:damage-inducible protein DinB [Hyphomicrobium denitrificans]
MISAAYVQTMARYNAWQNRNVYDAAEKLTDAQRRENRGAFFGSIHATLNHLLWADQIWLSRFGAGSRLQA